MSLSSDLNHALHFLLNTGELLHWRDYKYPNRHSVQQSASFSLLIQDSSSDENIEDDRLVNYFTDAQIEFIKIFRRAVNAKEKQLEDIFAYAVSLSERDLNLSEFQNDEIVVEFAIGTGYDLETLSNTDEPFGDPQYLLLSALAANPSLDLELAKKICDSYVQDAMEDSKDGWVAIGLIANPNFKSLHQHIIGTFAHALVNYWGALEQIVLNAKHIQNSDLDSALVFREIYSYDMGRVVESFDDLFHYEWDMMRDSKEADNPEFVPLYNVAAIQNGLADVKSGIALLDDGSNRLVYFGRIEESYKSAFAVSNYPSVKDKIVRPILDKSKISLKKYSAEKINDVFGGASQEIWDFLCTELDTNILEGLILFRNQELIEAILASDFLPKELKVLAALHRQ